MFNRNSLRNGASEGTLAAQGGGGFSGLIMMVAIFAIFYFHPDPSQQKKMKEHKKMVDELKKGDEIVTRAVCMPWSRTPRRHADGQDRRRRQGEDHRGSVGAVVKAEERRSREWSPRDRVKKRFP